MNKMKIRRLVLAALFTALTVVATMVIRVPSPLGGYANLGDTLVLLSAWVLGPVWGMAAGGIGSMLADLLGYPPYAVATLVIKALMALLAGGIFRAMGRKGRRLVARLVGALAAEVVMVLGYFAFEGLFLGLGWSAALNIPFNLVQGAVCLVAAVALAQVLERARALEHLQK